MSSESDMTKKTASHCTPLSIFYRSPRLMQGLGLLGSLGMLGSGLVVAQTESTTDSVIVPTAPAAPPVVEAAPNPAPPAPVSTAAPKPAAPEPIVVPPTSTRTIPAPQPAAPAPATPAPKKPALAAPNLSAPSASTPANPPQVILNSERSQGGAATATNPGNRFIDRTNYGQGATGNYNAPSSVVLTERSTGCQTVSQNGKLVSGTCGGVASPQQVANNSAATPREPQLEGVKRLPTPPTASVQPTRVSSASLGGRGVRLARQGQPSTKPSAAQNSLAYYNLSRRPLEQLKLPKDGFMFPLAVPASITSMFGWRVHPISGDYRFHAGTDLGAPQGTPVVAAAKGEVVAADYWGGYGLIVVLRHEDNTQESRYAHLSDIFVRPGDKVEQGMVIGRVGSTGNSTGPHLHFEWRHRTDEGWVAVDAGESLKLSLAQFIRALQIAQAESQSRPQS